MARNLLQGTALRTGLTFLATLAALPAAAQPAPNARPGGGTVVAGAAAISRTASNTRIDQASQRAAIDWRSFDVGSQQSITFNQPSANAVALNRVTGPDLSRIAGRIDANGQIVLVNQSGVTFYQGAQVNAAGVMVSAANISTQNFMAGAMKFDQPGRPDARIDNHGAITVRQAGLAALVAPQVANAGTITARLGHVVLAGAKTATLDLYGDGLLSLDVTNQVTQAPVGPDGRAATALVTNTGVIAADGGTVQLTAQAADGIVQTLVQAGGTIRAATVGERTGTVALNGVGGSIVVEGQLAAPGAAPGTRGGAIEVVANRDVVVAAGATIDASGQAGGGRVALGTTLDRARVAAGTAVRSGATISADATGRGDGGRVTVLSGKATSMAGTITAKAGAAGGNGGSVEVSGEAGFSLTGAIDVTAPSGSNGTILLDPRDLFISATNPGNGAGLITPDPTGVPANGLPDASTDSWLTPASIRSLSGAVTIATTRDLFVQSAVNTIDSGVTTLALSAGRNLSIAAPVTNSDALSLSAGGGITLSSGALVTAPTITLSSGIGGITLTGNAVLGQPGSFIDMTSAGPVSEAATSTIVAGTLTSGGGVTGNVSLLGDSNAISVLQNFSVTGGDLVVVNGMDLTLLGTVAAQNLFFDVGFEDTLTFGLFPDGPETFPANLTATAANGRITLVADAYVVASPDSSINTTGGTVELAPASATNVSLLGSPEVNCCLVIDNTLLPIIKTGGGTLEVGGFTDVPAGATVPQASASSVTIDGAADLTGIASTLRLDTTGPITQPGGPLTVTTLTGSAGSALLDNPDNRITNLGGFTTGGGEESGALLLVDSGALNITGPVSATLLSLAAGGPLQIGTTGAAGSLTAATMVLSATGAITEPNGAITADSFTASTAGGAGDILLTNGNNKIASSSGITASGGNVVLVDDPTLVLTGTYSGNGLFFEVAGAGDTLMLGTPTIVGETVSGGPAVLTAVGTSGRISLVADNVTVGNPASSVTTNAGTVEVAPFSAINTSLFGTGGLVVGAPLVSIIHTAGGTLEVGGFTNVPLGATVPAASASSVTVGAVDLTNVASTLRLDSLGPITQTGGPLTVANLTGSAGTSAALTDPANMIGALGAFTTAAGFALVDNEALSVTGPVQDTGAASTLALTTRTGDITLPGKVSATNVADLTSAGAINETGTLQAGTLSGSATGAANLTGANQVATLLDFTAGSFALNDSSNLLLAGTLNAAQIAIHAPASQVSLGDGATILTAAAPGALVQAADFSQLGSSSVLGQGGGPATLRIATTGHAQFDPPLGLQATGTSLILDLSGGTAAGSVFVNALDVIYTTPGGANLTGTIAGVTGGDAARLGTIQPAINADYLFNGCVIGAAACRPTVPVSLNIGLTATLGAIYPLITGPPPVLAGPPDLVLVALPMLQARPPQLTDPDVVPPNITYLDY